MSVLQILVGLNLALSVVWFVCTALAGREADRLRKQVIDLQVEVAELSKYRDQVWRWKGKEVRSLGGVVWNHTQYVVLEPAGRGFTPHFVRRDDEKLELIG